MFALLKRRCSSFKRNKQRLNDFRRKFSYNFFISLFRTRFWTWNHPGWEFMSCKIYLIKMMRWKFPRDTSFLSSPFHGLKWNLKSRCKRRMGKKLKRRTQFTKFGEWYKPLWSKEKNDWTWKFILQFFKSFTLIRREFTFLKIIFSKIVKVIKLIFISRFVFSICFLAPLGVNPQLFQGWRLALLKHKMIWHILFLDLFSTYRNFIHLPQMLFNFLYFCISLLLISFQWCFQVVLP